MARNVACICVAVCCALTLTSQTGRALPATSAAEWLAKTELWLGGHEALSRVKALQIGRGQSETVRILLPDRYQIETVAPYGKTLITFDGATIWTKSDLAALNEPSAIAPDVLRRRGLGRLAEMTLTYLSRPPAAWPMVPRLADNPCGMGDVGVCIAFEPATGATMFLVLSRDDGRPLALRRLASALPDQPPTQEYVSELSDYRTISGVKFPFKITTRRRELSTGKVEVLETSIYRDYVVNPPLKQSDFVKPSKH